MLDFRYACTFIAVFALIVLLVNTLSEKRGRKEVRSSDKGSVEKGNSMYRGLAFTQPSSTRSSETPSTRAPSGSTLTPTFTAASNTSSPASSSKPSSSRLGNNNTSKTKSSSGQKKTTPPLPSWTTSHRRLLLRDTLQPSSKVYRSPGCARQDESEWWRTHFNRCDVATLDTCRDTAFSPNETFCELGQSPAIMVDDILFLYQLTSSYFRFLAAVALARNRENNKTMYVSRASKLLNYFYYSDVTFESSRHGALLKVAQVLNSLPASYGKHVHNITGPVFWAFDSFPSAPSHFLDELYAAACTYVLSNLSGIPWMIPFDPLTLYSRSDWIHMFALELNVSTVHLMSNTVYRASKVHFPLFFHGVRPDDTGCRAGLIQRFLKSPTVANWKPVKAVAWLKLEVPKGKPGSHHFSPKQGAFHLGKRFAGVLSRHHVLLLTANFGLHEKLFYINHATLLIATYGGILYSIMINRRPPPFMQYLLVLQHKNYGSNGDSIILAGANYWPVIPRKKPAMDMETEYTSYGEWMYHDHIVDAKTKRKPAQPIPNMTVKVVRNLTKLDVITDEDLQYLKWEVTSKAKSGG